MSFKIIWAVLRVVNNKVIVFLNVSGWAIQRGLFLLTRSLERIRFVSSLVSCELDIITKHRCSHPTSQVSGCLYHVYLFRFPSTSQVSPQEEPSRGLIPSGTLVFQVLHNIFFITLFLFCFVFWITQNWALVHIQSQYLESYLYSHVLAALCKITNL